MDIVEIVKSLYRNPAGSSLLLKYVDRDYWIDKLQKYFPNSYINNITDFNYAKCFSMYINLSDIRADIGSKEFHEHIENEKDVYGIIIEISVLASYCVFKYSRYYIDGQTKCETSSIPYCEKHMEFNKIINNFISDYHLILLDDNTLMREVPDICLELKEPPVSVYNCLFQDDYSYYPYSIEKVD
ncbi:hypothetical protein GCM10008908_28830 [Clostridium subterminale]|uniref:Uncharacterized protein n=1 Tax=Clostridium subterminale TaxID=1550 RepID=A0ABP3W2Z5_CLOSU